MTQVARGTFEVTLTTLPSTEQSQADCVGRMSIGKQFHGALKATSLGEMLSAGTETRGSAGYVALERVNGSLHGRDGSFVLQHSGTMARGTGQLSVTIVPDSGTGQLVGIAGKMVIVIVDRKHSYEFGTCSPTLSDEA